jgi:hypothetical protein
VGGGVLRGLSTGGVPGETREGGLLRNTLSRLLYLYGSRTIQPIFSEEPPMPRPPTSPGDGRGRRPLVWMPLMLSVLLLGLLAGPLSGQVSLGVHGVSATDAFGGTQGVGGRLAFSLPLLPVDFMASAETFFPDCGDLDCSLRGVSLDASMDLLPLPVVRPYVTGGFTIRRFDTGLGEGTREARGLNAGAGVNVGLAGLRLFGEGRYEFFRAPERQTVFRLGILFGG